MASFVLVHGAWHGGWCFDAVARLLEADGNAVFAPDLPGMGGNDAELAGVTLAAWASCVSQACRTMAPPVVLVGHSRGGLVISQAAEQDPDAMAALVYVCAMLLPPGMSRAEWKQGQVPNPDFDALMRKHPSAPATTIAPEGAAAVFAQLSPPGLAEAAIARLVAEPDAPRLTPLALTQARYGRVPRHYIECLHDRTIPLADQRRMQAMQPCASVTSLDADHSPFLSAPRALADALIHIAETLQ